jgi:hypothetical protein
VQAILNGRVVAAQSRLRSHLDFPLRGFVRGDACGRPLTGSWSKGRAGDTRITTAKGSAAK